MTSKFLFLLRCGVGCLLLAMASLHAQEADDGESQPADASQETDINEENYRRFMELRDQSRQRPNAPYAVLAPPSNLEKMEKLPEVSQKHLRNQLLGIMLEGERWTPAEAETPYPFVPSEAATTDSLLRGMESDAWEELVRNYHARESRIYQAGERGRSATVDGGEALLRDDPGSSGTPGAETTPGQAMAGRHSIEPSNNGRAGNEAQAARQAGATLSALEYLTGGASGKEGAASASDSTGDAQASATSTTDERANPGASSALAAEPSDSENKASASAASAEAAASESAAASQADSMQSASQDSTATTPDASLAQAGAQADGSEQDSQQQTAQEVDYRSSGVIAIRDLSKVKGTESEDTPEDESEDDGKDQ